MNNYPSDEVKRFGEELASALMNAHIQSCMGGLGGCKQYDLADFPTEFHQYINSYLEGNNDSLAITYAAMRTKEKELA